MLQFVNIREGIAFQERENISDTMFALQIGLDSTPLDFQYTASEAVTSFSAIRKDITGAIVETISLSTSLITYNAVDSTHICDGQNDYSTSLECGIYYYLINGKFQSEDFNVYVGLVEGTVNTKSNISISGLEFYDSNYDIPEYEKEGAPNITFAAEFGTNLKPLPFQYLAAYAVSSFDLVKISKSGSILSTTSLSTSLITYDSVKGTHICNGNTMYANIVTCGLYYFSVNSRYNSKVFEIFELLWVVIDNILITNAIEDDTAILTFDALLTGVTLGVEIELTYIFSCPIGTYTQDVVLTPVSQGVTSSFAIPLGVSGACSLTILNNVCTKAYTYNFTITPSVPNCFELIGGGNFELISGGCLELIG